MKVAKFGGTSLANAAQIKKVCDITIADEERRIIVVSAPGKREKNDIKVTDLLIALGEAMLKNGEAEPELEAVVDRFSTIIEDLGLEPDLGVEIKEDISQRLNMSREHEGKFMDAIKAAGEDNSAKVVAAYLTKMGYKASYINPKTAGMLLSDDFGNARVLEETEANLAQLADREEICVFPGFFGYTKSGEVATFPRGGSDITGSIIAAAVEADMYENFTDVDAVYAANPKLIKNPKAIPVFTYEEMRELSYAGFSVLHEETLEPVYKKGIPVNIKNTNNPSAPGTMIVKYRPKRKNPVVGVAGEKGFASIFVSKYLMNKEVGFGRKLLKIIEEEGISYDHTPSGIDNISVIVKEELIKGKEEHLMNKIRTELGAESVHIEKNKALVMVVGEEMKRTLGIAARSTKALCDAEVNIEMINQGSSEVSLMFGVNNFDCDRAVKALYNEFFNQE